ncbi:MAG: NAD-dependent epimerase/dehydratase family protein [Acidimicrobiia bacterium]|nr:NAD-dependent epimerase/dehydratase family protein [Acidimicrobiia bacterium]MDH5293580.1 NAD-dependent epimerase/dehydratase family protein [Acidimicrobiia bacterium]
MTILVTGGSGVVGSALVRHLVEGDDGVRTLSRSETSDSVLRAMGSEPVRGDILDRSALEAAMEGVALVYHVAGVNSMCVKDPAPMLEANIEGSLNVLAAARSAGVQRLVYTSSAATLGEARGEVGTERSVHRGWYLSDYERSKHLAEEAVLAQKGVDVVCVNPSSVQGPGRASGTGKIILDLVRGKLPFLVDTRVSIVDIDDCARGHIAAAERGVPGQRYLLNSFTVTMTEAVDLLEQQLGRQLSVRFLPGWVASAGAAGAEWAARMRRRQPSVCREMVRTMRHGHAYDGSRAESELGLSYTPAVDLMHRLLAWFESEGLL